MVDEAHAGGPEVPSAKRDPQQRPESWSVQPQSLPEPTKNVFFVEFIGTLQIVGFGWYR